MYTNKYHHIIPPDTDHELLLAVYCAEKNICANLHYSTE